MRTLTLRSGHTRELPRYRRLIEDTAEELSFIGGTVRDKAADGAPLAGIEVAVKGTGLFDTTDHQGRFTLGSLPSGQYTLVAWPPEGKPKEMPIRISVPVEEGNYDLEI